MYRPIARAIARFRSVDARCSVCFGELEFVDIGISTSACAELIMNDFVDVND